jgi:pimeloyl-ACP methyl ester carboxylesterase
MLDRREAFVLLGACVTAMASGVAAAQDFRIVEEPWSAGHLAGTFARPDGGPARGPAALIVAGSGPSTRDGSFQTYRLLAHALAEAGIRSVRYDKRGVGQSRLGVAGEADLRLQHFVDDTVLAARDLAARDDVSAVFIVGHSEGALLATLAALQMPVAGIVMLAGIGRRLDVVIREQLMAIPLPPEQEHLRKQALDILEKLARGERVEDVPREQAGLFRPSVQPFLISAFAVDPAAELARVKVPVLLVRGASDIQVSAADLDLLAKAKPDARVVVLPDTNHAFKAAPADVADRVAQLKSYDPAAPLVRGLAPAVIEFIRTSAR